MPLLATPERFADPIEGIWRHRQRGLAFFSDHLVAWWPAEKRHTQL